jgi:squalene-hopene/tetraprenyl-beta-curcumene cyclase
MTPAHEHALVSLHRLLMADYDSKGHWTGRLSSSALASALAVRALAEVDRQAHAAPIARGLDWVATHANPDGGWGDSPESPSNLTATVLCWAVFSLADTDNTAHASAIHRAEQWLSRQLGDLRPESLRAGILARYGNDRTFAAPILTLCTLCGRMGPPETAWRLTPQLPCELALLPHWLYRWMKLTVVSYALPALIAIGLARHRCARDEAWWLRLLRKAATPRLLDIARRMQPVHGGYEEATPLTAFVTVSLAAAGFREDPIVKRGVQFLIQSMRDDGSWPIDTNLATWVTTLSVNTLTETDRADITLGTAQRGALRDWLLRQQHREVHPLTRGTPGGWAWTDLPGGMPDADDTPGALIALRRLGAIDPTAIRAASQGIDWLLSLQNSDGGIPTFSRGWGKLPFDRSCPDLSAHTLQSFAEWLPDLPQAQRRRMQRAMGRIIRYLKDTQRRDGSWVLLWFGSQFTRDEGNPVIGTARVCMALRAAEEQGIESAIPLRTAGLTWLEQAQNEDAGWGATRGMASSFEETGLAVAALSDGEHREAVKGGVSWIAGNLPQEALPASTPVGLYFAKLWYSERLYPVIFALQGLIRAARSGNGRRA